MVQRTLDDDVLQVGRQVAAALPRAHRPLQALDERAMELATQPPSCEPRCFASSTSPRPAGRSTTSPRT